MGISSAGGLKESFRVRLTVPSQEVQEGAFTVIRSGDWQYYGIVTDIQLGATDRVLRTSRPNSAFRRRWQRRCTGQTLYTNLEVLPTLMLERGPEPGSDAY